MAASYRSFSRVIRSVLCVVLCVAFVNYAQGQVSVTGFVIPIYYTPGEMVKGQTNLLKLRILGEAGEMRGDGYFITRTRLEYLGPDARTNFTAEAPECVLNRQHTAIG